MSPIHPEGEDTQPDPLETVRCPNCGKPISVPELANVELFVCPECGKPIEIAKLLKTRS